SIGEQRRGGRGASNSAAFATAAGIRPGRGGAACAGRPVRGVAVAASRGRLVRRGEHGGVAPDAVWLTGLGVGAGCVGGRGSAARAGRGSLACGGVGGRSEGR